MVEASYGWSFQSADQFDSLDGYVNRADNKMYDMKSRRRLSGRLSNNAQSELNRRLGSVKQQVFVLSPDPKVHAELTELLDSGYLITHLDSAEEALRQLQACDEMTLVFIDHRLEGQAGLYQFARELPDKRRQNVIPVLLAEREESGIIEEAFTRGVQDVLTKPFNTPLNKHRIRFMSQMGQTNRKLGQLLEQQMAGAARGPGGPFGPGGPRP